MRKKRNSHAGTRGFNTIVDAMNKSTSRRSTIFASPRKETTPRKREPESPNKALSNAIVRVNKACVDGFFSSRLLIELKEKLDAVLAACGSDEDQLIAAWGDFRDAIEGILEKDVAVRKREFVEDELGYLLARVDKIKGKTRLWGSQLDEITEIWKKIHDSVGVAVNAAQYIDPSNESAALRDVSALLHQLHHGLLTDFGDFFTGLISDKSERTRVVFDCCFIVKKVIAAVDPAVKWAVKDSAVKKAMKLVDVAMKRKFDPNYEPDEVIADDDAGKSESPRRQRLSFGENETSPKFMSERYAVGRKSMDDPAILKRRLWEPIEKEQKQKNKPKRVQPKIELTPTKEDRVQENWETMSVTSNVSRKSQKQEDDISDLTEELRRAKTEEQKISEEIAKIKKEKAILKKKRSKILHQKAGSYDADQEKVETLKQEIESIRQEYILLQKEEAAIIEMQKTEIDPTTIEREVSILDEACAMFTGTVQAMEDELDHLTNLNNILKSGEAKPPSHEHNSYSSSEQFTPNPRRPITKLEDDSFDYSHGPSDFEYLKDAVRIDRSDADMGLRKTPEPEEPEEEETKPEPASDYSNEPNRHFSNGSQDLTGFDFNFDANQNKPNSPEEKNRHVSVTTDSVFGEDNSRLKEEIAELTKEFGELSKQRIALLRDQMATMRFDVDGLPKEISTVIRAMQLNTQMMNDQIIELENTMRMEERQIQTFITTQPLRVRNSIAEANVGLRARLQNMIDKKKQFGEKRNSMESQWKEIDAQLNEIAKQKRRGPLKTLKLCDVSESARGAFLELEKSRGQLKRTLDKINLTMKDYNAAAAQARRKVDFLRETSRRAQAEPDLLLLRMNIENARLADEITKIETLSQTITRKYDMGSQPKGLSRSLAALKRVIGVVMNRMRSKALSPRL